MVPRVLPIVEKTHETRDTFTLHLDSGDIANRFSPGQFNMLWAFGVGESAVSLSGDPDDTRHIVHTIRIVGAVTQALGRLERGDAVAVRGPFGVPWPVESARGRDVVVIAGGIGIAPLRPLLSHLARRRGEVGRVSVLYGARTPADLLFATEHASWADRFDVATTVDRADPSWRGRVGVVPALVEDVVFDPMRTVAFVCGPEVMMRFAVRALEQRGVPADAIYLSLERNMQCAIGSCGHCLLGPLIVCKDGPVLPLTRVRPLLGVWEL